MKPIFANSKTLATTRRQRLAAYRALLDFFELERRQAIARSRLIQLRRDALWGWLPL